MLYNLNDTPSIANYFVAELRDSAIQTDRLRFRYNLERLGEVLAYQISTTMEYEVKEVETQLGVAEVMLPADEVILATILRAGMPMHNGLLRFFDRADNAFVSAYRKHHKDGTFEIKMEYVSCPSVEGKVLILTDPMLATGSSLVMTLKALLESGTPKAIHVATAIAAVDGINNFQRNFPDVHIWTGAVDEELTAKSYIVPGLGDAGDLAYGEKLTD